MTVYKKSNISQIPSSTGVYLFKKKNKTIYIGKSINLRARIKSHIENAKKDIKEKKIIGNFDRIEIIKTDYEFNALLLESMLINKYKPIYNARWRDHKSYLYIKITKDKFFPKIFISRKEKNSNAIYYGPFPSVKNVEYLLKQIRKIFPYCSQKKISKKGCFYSKIGLCNPCPNVITNFKDEIIKKSLITRYKKNIYYIRQIFNGKNLAIEKYFLKKINKLSLEENFEKAIEYRNKLLLFQKLIYMHVYANIDIDPLDSSKLLGSLLAVLKKYFKKIKTLKRIECFDISNISFQYSTGSMVVAISGELDKSKYRKFKIKRKNRLSDLWMLEEVLRRRFNNKWPLPDLILVDGGTPQVLTSLKLLKKLNLDIPLIGIAKNPNRLIIGVEGLPRIRHIMSDPKYRLLILLRDESHRFAKKYHLYLRDLKFQSLPK